MLVMRKLKSMNRLHIAIDVTYLPPQDEPPPHRLEIYVEGAMSEFCSWVANENKTVFKYDPETMEVFIE